MDASRLEYERSLALHEEVARKLRDDPAVLERAWLRSASPLVSVEADVRFGHVCRRRGLTTRRELGSWP